VDLAKVPAATLETVRGAMRVQMRALTAALGTSELPIDVWLDAKGRLRRVQIDLAAALPTPAEESLAADSGAASDNPNRSPLWMSRLNLHPQRPEALKKTRRRVQKTRRRGAPTSRPISVPQMVASPARSERLRVGLRYRRLDGRRR
jgi:hypothetical protein